MNKPSVPQPVSVTQPIRWMLTATPQREGKEGITTLITGQRSYTHQRMHTLIVELALAGPVKVLIGGNRYDHYRINYALAAATPLYEYILAHHIHLSRAETCYQMVELLTQTQADPAPCLVLDLLTTFYDGGISEREIAQLLFETILQLRRLSRETAVTVSAYTEEKRPQLLKAIESAADQVERPPAPSFQPLRQPILIG
ncbi:MAG: hypothetical protein AB8I58_14845 [Anaerolineales bacterium]